MTDSPTTDSTNMGADHPNGQRVEVAREAGNPQAADSAAPVSAKAVKPDSSRHAPPPAERRSLHTPGPWSVEDPMDYELSIVEANKAVHEWRFIACVPHGGKKEGDFPKVIAEANARLIAAAPELLASLKEMGDWIAAGLQASDEAWPDGRCLQHTEEIAARARTAVDKAEGRS